MTREEAIECLYDIKTDAIYKVTTKEKEALDMAMEALEEQDNDQKFRQGILEHVKQTSCLRSVSPIN